MTQVSSSAGGVRSVHRAAIVLEILARDGEASLGAMGREIGVHTSTVSRLVDALAEHDLVARPDGPGGYRLGPGCLRLAAEGARTLDVSTVAQPICDRLAADLEETCNVAILSDSTAVNVCQAEGTTTVATRNWIGQLTPCHVTSNGKVLLAHLDEAERARVLPDRLERFTSHTITRRDRLARELREVRARGYAYAREEYEEGLQAVAAPIHDHSGRVIAALSAAGPVYRVSDERFPEVRDAVVAAAREISAKLGYRDPG